MLIYNVTVNVEESIERQWMQWMKDIYIPEMLQTNLFTKARILRVMVEEEMGGITYSVQYYVKNKESLEKYYAEHSEAFRNKELDKFVDKFVSFSTELEVISEHQGD